MKALSRLVELMEDWKFLLRRDGFQSALTAAILDVARLPYRHLRFIVLARSLVEPFPNFRPKIGLEIRPFEAADLKLVSEIDRPSEARLCARRLERKHYGLTAWYQKQLAGYAWGCSEMSEVTERVIFPLEPGDILCNDAFTSPTFRGQGVQTALALARFRLFGDLGLGRAICYIETRNAPSLAVWQRKLSGHAIGKIDFLRIGPWYRVRYQRDPPGGALKV